MTIEEAMQRIALLEILLAHAVNEADGWHDETRSGPIEGDQLIDEARELLGIGKLVPLIPVRGDSETHD